MFEGSIETKLDPEVAVLPHGMDIHLTQFEAIRTLQQSGATVEYHHVGLLDVYRQLPYVLCNEIIML